MAGILDDRATGISRICALLPALPIAGETPAASLRPTKPNRCAPYARWTYHEYSFLAGATDYFSVFVDDSDRSATDRCRINGS
jgi:hypothetical protein